MNPQIKVLASKKFNKYTIEAYNFIDRWLPETPAPASWNEIVYQVTKDGKKVKNFPVTVAKIGTELVAQFSTPQLF
jgi:hypothetical protein